MNDKLLQLSEIRRSLVSSLRKSRVNLDQYAVDPYSQANHFIYELIQNADDVRASKIVFVLSEKMLRIEHDGELFTYDQVDAITTLGSSTKSNQVNAIGKFGGGFKSVFNVTDSPHIHSGDYHFRIIDLFVPEEIEAIDCGKNTIIELPFNKNNSEAVIYDQIAETVENFEKESLLFLNNIKRIEWKIGEEFRNYYCHRKIRKEVNTIKEETNNSQNDYQYLVFNRQINLGGKELNLAIAYLMQDNQLVPIEKPIFVYFPTAVRLGFKFIIHVPYKTPPSRETINFYDSENQELTSQLIELIVDSIFQIRDLRRIDIAGLNEL